MRVVLGIGCDRNASLPTLQEAVALALRQASLTQDAVSACASIDKKNDEVALLQLCAEQDWPLQFYSAEQLARVEVPNPSETVRKYMGTPAVAEAAALLAAGGYGRSPLPGPLPQAGEGGKVSLRESPCAADMSALIVEKLKHRGADGKNATVSIARLAT